MPCRSRPSVRRNFIPGCVVLICRKCGLMRLEHVGDWIPATGGAAYLSGLARITQERAQVEARENRQRQLRDAITQMEFE